MSNTSSNYHGISKITVNKVSKTDDHPYEYLTISLTSTDSTHSIVVFGEEDTVNIELEI
jgi:hypothetical protein